MQTVLGIFTKKIQADEVIKKLATEGFNEEKSSMIINDEIPAQSRIGSKGGRVRSPFTKKTGAILLAIPVLGTKERQHVKSILKQHEVSQIEVVRV